MISTSTSEPISHTPPWRSGNDAPVFLLRAGSVRERGALEADLTSEGGGRVFAYELYEAFKSGISTLLADDPDHPQLIELAASEMSLGKGETLPEDEAALIEGARKVLAEHWPAYRALNLQMARRKELAPILSLSRFCVGWANVGVDFKRGVDGRVSDELLGKLNPLEMLSAGNAAYALLYPSEADTEGNSPRGSQSGVAPQVSNSDGSSKADGKSKGAAGRKTPAARSRRTSSK